MRHDSDNRRESAKFRVRPIICLSRGNSVAAAIASTVSFAPQALKIVRTGETTDISLRMYLLTVTAFALWMLYGLLLRQWPLALANTLCLVMVAFILTMKALPPPAARRLAKTLRNRLGLRKE